MIEILDHLTSALAGRYTIERELGRGGMAVVYLAQDVKHERPVAIKVMLPEVVGEDGAERFKREIQLAARLSHPHILTVFDSGDADGLFFYVMPYVEGESLRDAIAAQRQLGIVEAVAFTRQVAEALDYAHAQGVVHRDIKPANIMLARFRVRGGGLGGRTPMVTDFGIARAMSGDASKRLTSTGLLVGTPTYMSPEQWGGGYPVDGRSDQYSLGCVLYEMLIGDPPFTGSSPMAVLARHTCDAVPSLRVVRSTIPEALEQVIFRALAKVPADRFDSMGDFADALATATEAPINYSTLDQSGPMASSTTTPARMPGGSSIPGRVTPGTLPAGAPKSGLALLRGSGGRLRAMLVGVALVALTSVGVASFLSRRDPAVMERVRLVVLPFRQTGPVGDSTLADGLTEEVISRLSGVPRLGVVARTSAMKYKGTTKSAKEIGEELKVSKLVQGTVKWKGGDARKATVSVSIVNVADEEQSPVSDFDASSLTDLYGIANAVAAKLVTGELEDKERARLLAKPTGNREAYRAFQQGNHSYNRSWDPIDVRAAVAKYEEATRLDPKFALALAALGRAHGWMYQLNIDATPARLVLARQFIDSAISLAPELPEARLALGLYYYWGKRDYESAMKEFAMVQRSLPSSAETFNFMGNVSRRKGDLRDAVVSYGLAADLDPRSHQTLFNRAETLMFLREFAVAEQLVNRVLEIAPDFIDGFILKATLQIHGLGDPAAARNIIDSLAARIPPTRWRPTGHHWDAGLFRIIDDNLASVERRTVLNSFGLDTSHHYSARAEAYRRFGKTTESSALYDSLATFMEATVKRHPEWPGAHGQLALAYAGQGRELEAVRSAERAAEILNETNDALDGPQWITNVAVVYARVGNVDKAIEWLDKAMRIPSRLSPKWLALDPVWTPIRHDPRFQNLIRKPPPLRERTGQVIAMDP
ncbi:MAG: protein kinase [Gemmatimonadaceae bacterium]|nr:protein kinase [Gemmatimonadaceae bacterium]MDQ3520644.1 protein kinase [Gemmatimonadota bacterium]